MAYFALSGVTGCVEPPSGGTGTHIYDQQFNEDKIVSYYKKNISKSDNNDWVEYFSVIIVFENYTQPFKFLTSGNRDTFYASLP